MKFELKYAKSTQGFILKEKNYLGTLLPNELPCELTDEQEVRRALEHPIGSSRLSELVSPGERVVIVTSDITRPMPSYRVLPEVIEELARGGVAKRDITVILALGSHRKHTEEEKEALVGTSVYQSEVKILDSDMNECIRLGMCRNGTPVDLFRPVVEADRRICLGNIEYHYFAGYSGGIKALMPGVSSHEAIQANHANMVSSQAYAGNLDTNPVRQDMEEVGKYIDIDFIINVVLDEKKKIIRAFAGHFQKAHREGCAFLDRMYKIPLEKQADIVILSPGGFPKDINIYQSQKGLDNAKHAVRPGGILIWCASAAEGFGEKTFEEWMKTKRPKDMIEEIKVNFRLGGHKAAAIAMVLETASIFMVSDLPHALLRSIGMIPFDSIQVAVNEAIRLLGEESQVLVLPMAGSTLPDVRCARQAI